MIIFVYPERETIDRMFMATLLDLITNNYLIISAGIADCMDYVFSIHS